MQLHSLLRSFDPRSASSSTFARIADIEITGVSDDSRQIQPGYLFVARGGTRTDGAAYVQDAAARGAVAAVVATKAGACSVPQIVVSDPCRAASILANLFHESPSLSMRCFAVTGTNGKTTTTYLLRHLLSKVQQRCGLIGTVEIDDGRSRRPAEMTTPPPCFIAETLAAMRDRGCRAAAIEVSSHALDQHRTDGVFFCGAAFTNLTGDHLDYHQTMENYATAKARLFESLDPEAVAVINDNSKWSDRMIQDCPARIIRFGFTRRSDYRASQVHTSIDGTQFMLHTPDGKAEVSMKLIGRHNIENALAAAALVGEGAGGVTINQIAAGLHDATGAPGRLQRVETAQGRGFSVFVDYAHTDDALENVLSALRSMTRGKLRVMFGCGGDRDNSKRPRMARVAEKIADVVYVTSDNPRTEDPIRIIEQIRRGFGKGREQKEVIIEQERRRAIERVLGDARDGDVVLLAGKGHENYQIIGKEKHHFDDVEEAQRVMTERAVAA